MKEQLEMRGRLTVMLTDRNGRVVEARQHRNRIVTSGRHLVAEMFGGVTGAQPPPPVTHIAVGTDATAPADGDLALKGERPYKKGEPAYKPITGIQYSEITENEPGKTSGSGVKRVRVSLTTVFDYAEANDQKVALREAGTFSQSTAGWVMYNRVVFDPVFKTDTFKLTLLWDVDF